MLDFLMEYASAQTHAHTKKKPPKIILKMYDLGRAPDAVRTQSMSESGNNSKIRSWTHARRMVEAIEVKI